MAVIRLTKQIGAREVPSRYMARTGKLGDGGIVHGREIFPRPGCEAHIAHFLVRHPWRARKTQPCLDMAILFSQPAQRCQAALLFGMESDRKVGSDIDRMLPEGGGAVRDGQD